MPIVAILLAGTIALTWDAVPGATGYRVYLGSSAQLVAGMSPPVNVPTIDVTDTSAVVTVDDCGTHAVAVTATAPGTESPGLSNVVVGWPAPIIGTLVDQGNGQYKLSGANFAPGCHVELNGSADLTRVVDSCTTIIITLAQPLTPGELVTVAVENPDLGYGSSQTLVAVVLTNVPGVARTDIAP